MSKRPVAFRVPRLFGDMVSHYFVTTSEDEARAMADTNQVEYEGLYLVGDRHTFTPAQPARKPMPVKHYTGMPGAMINGETVYDWLMDDGSVEAMTASDVAQRRALAAQPPAAPVETDALGVIESDRLFAEQIQADFGAFEEGITDKEKLAQWIRNVRRASSTPDAPPLQSSSAETVEACDLVPLFRDAASVNMTEEAVERQALRFAEAVLSLYDVRKR